MISRWLSRTWNKIGGWLLGLYQYVRWWLRSRRLTYRIRAWAGDRYAAVQPILTKTDAYETFIRLGHMEITVTVGGKTLQDADAAPIARKLWDRGRLFGSDPSVEYKLETGETVYDPGDVPPGTAIEEIRMANTIRVPPGFLD